METLLSDESGTAQRAVLPLALQIVLISSCKIIKKPQRMHSPGAVESDFQPTDHFRIIAGRLGNVLEHVQQGFRADELRLPYPRNYMPRNFLPDRLELFFFDIGGIDQHVRMQVGVIETDLIYPDCAPPLDSLH